MKFREVIALSAVLSALPLTSMASPIPAPPFGVASGYNLVALGTVDSKGKTVLAGTINDGADVTGRVAAAGKILNISTIGSGLNADPFKSSATFNGTTYDVVATGGIQSGLSININSHGDVFSTSPVSGNMNFNGGGHLVTGPTGPIDFDSLRSSLDAETIFLGALGTTGTVVGTGSNSYGNPSFFVLLGTDPNLNVFKLTTLELQSINQNNSPIDIVAPAGSTIIINVDGKNVTLGKGGLYYNGNQTSGDNAADSKILFNAPDAASVYIDGQFSASLLAPSAVLTGGSQMAGTFIAAQIGSTGEVHNVEFDGNLPTPPTTPAVPEPGTLALVGTGILSVAGAMRRKKNSLID